MMKRYISLFLILTIILTQLAGMSFIVDASDYDVYVATNSSTASSFQRIDTNNNTAAGATADGWLMFTKDNDNTTRYFTDDDTIKITFNVAENGYYDFYLDVQGVSVIWDAWNSEDAAGFYAYPVDVETNDGEEISESNKVMLVAAKEQGKDGITYNDQPDKYSRETITVLENVLLMAGTNVISFGIKSGRTQNKMRLYGAGLTYKSAYTTPSEPEPEPEVPTGNINPFSFELDTLSSETGTLADSDREFTSNVFGADFDWKNFRGTLVMSMDVNVRADVTADRQRYTDLLDINSGLYFSKDGGKSVILATVPGVTMAVWQASYADGVILKMITNQSPWANGGDYVNNKPYTQTTDNYIAMSNGVAEMIGRRPATQINGSPVGMKSSNRGYANGMFGMGAAGSQGARWGVLAGPTKINLQTVIEKTDDYEWVTTHYMNGRIVAGTVTKSRPTDEGDNAYVGFSGIVSSPDATDKSRIDAKDGFRFYMKTADSEQTIAQTVENIKVSVYGTTENPAADGNTKVSECVEVGNDATVAVPVVNIVSGGAGAYIPESIESVKVVRVAKHSTGLMEGEDVASEGIIALESNTTGVGSINLGVSVNEQAMDWDNHNYIVTFNGVTDIIGSLYNPSFDDKKTDGFANDIVLEKKGQAFVNNSVILYKGTAPQIYSSEFYKEDSTDALESNLNYLANKIELKTALTSRALTLNLGESEVATGTTTADGDITFALGTNKVLGTGKEYTIKSGDTVIGKFTTTAADSSVWAELTPDKTQAKIFNLTDDNVESTYLVFSTASSIDYLNATDIAGNSIVTENVPAPLSGDNGLSLTVFDTFGSASAVLDKNKVAPEDFFEDNTNVTTKTGHKNAAQRLAVFKGGWTSTPNDAACAENLVMVKTATTNESGEATYNLDFRGKATDKYVIAVYTGGEIYYTTVLFAAAAENTTALGILNSSADVAAVKTAIADISSPITIDKFFEYLEVDFSGYAFDASQRDAILGDVIKHKIMKSATFTKDTAKEVFKKYTALKALETKKATKIENVADCFDVFVTDGDVKNWYSYRNSRPNENERVSIATTDSWRTTLYSKVAKSFSFDDNNALTKVEVFEKAVREELLLAIVASAESEEQLGLALGDFQSNCSLNSDLIGKSKVLSAIWKQTYATVSALKTAMQTANNQYNYDPPAGGGGGGAGKYDDKYFEKTDDPIQPTDPGITPGTSQPATTFSDVGDSHWAKDYIEELYEKGIVSGTSAKEFSPSDNVKREEFVKMIVNAAGLEIADYKEGFGDVKIDDWYATYVITALENGLINGVAADRFGAGQEITRQDIAVILYKALAEKTGEVEGAPEFADSDSISDYAVTAVKALADLKIINGYEDKTFRANEKATRAEAAKMICEFLKIYAE